MLSIQEDYNELNEYTLSHPSPTFIHQYTVDAFAAQNANEQTKPITLIFALIGLYLHIEKSYTGKAVQKMHMQLARKHKPWPLILLPKERGAITVSDVVEASAGYERDNMIDIWCRAVWKAYNQSHQIIKNLMQEEFNERK